MVFYNHIKGVTTTDNDNRYYFIQFGKASGRDFPKLGFSDSTSFPSDIPEQYGEFLTTGSSESIIPQTIYADKQLQFGSSDTYLVADSSSHLTIKSNELLIIDTGSIYLTGKNLYFNNSASYSLIYDDELDRFDLSKSINITGNIQGSGNLTIGGVASITGNTNITGSLDVGNGITSHKAITVANDYILAPYFVATSDKNYKENFKPLPSTLDFINSTQLYTFNYKSTPNDRNIGIIAQDVESTTFDEFNLVLNITSNGKSYKAVKETKLTYILWKGLQEESGKIEALEAKVAALEAKLEMMSKFFALPENLDAPQE